MKPSEETQVTTELLPVISVYIAHTGLWVSACIMLKHNPRAWNIGNHFNSCPHSIQL